MHLAGWGVLQRSFTQGKRPFGSASRRSLQGFPSDDELAMAQRERAMFLSQRDTDSSPSRGQDTDPTEGGPGSTGVYHVRGVLYGPRMPDMNTLAHARHLLATQVNLRIRGWPATAVGAPTFPVRHDTQVSGVR